VEFSARSVQQLCEAAIEEVLEAVFSARSVQQLCEAAIEEVLEVVFSVRSVRKCFSQDKPRVVVSCKRVAGQ
jgi:hypothetical protein